MADLVIHPIIGGDANVVSNLRQKYGDKVVIYSDQKLAVAWYYFSLSDEFPDGQFLDWPQSFVDTDYPEKGFK
jgi:hypothetical protein